MTVSVAVAQFAAASDKSTNRAVITDLVERAAAAGARLVAIPENAMWSHPDSSTDLYPIAESLDGSFSRFLSELAAAHGVWLVAGMTERAADVRKVHNTLLVIDDAGKQVTRYRKVHLYDAFGYRESDNVEPGLIEDPAVFDLDGVRFGVLTCYDLRFPEAARRLADAGADALVLPAAWVAGPMKEDHWVTLLRARAIENTVYVAAAGQTGPVCVGQSCVIDPSGVVTASAGPAPGVVVSEVDPARLALVRETAPVLRHRRFQVVPR